MADHDLIPPTDRQTAKPEFAPSWLPRQQRRRIDRKLQKLLRRRTCSICGRPLKHNSRTASGLDAQSNVVVAGECCMHQIAEVFGLGLYSDRPYDFMSPRKPESELFDLATQHKGGSREALRALVEKYMPPANGGASS
jgi:hypothetical protein